MQTAPVLAIAIVCCGCTRIPRIREYDEQANSASCSAPLVIVGIAEGDRIVGPAFPSRRDPSYPMLMHRVRVHIENTLRGRIDQPQIDVYYFAFGGGFEGPRPLGFGKEPSRRILWIRRDSGVYRMACDGWDGCTMFVWSGAHPGYSAATEKPLGYAIADIILTRGEGPIDKVRFATGVLWGVPDRGVQGHVIEKLSVLVRTETADIKDSACQILWIYGQDQIAQQLQQAARDAGRASNCNCALDEKGSLRCHPAP